MGADKLGGGYGGGVVLAYGDPKLLLLALGHQPGLMDPFGRYILQLWDPSLHILSLQVIVLQPDVKSDGALHHYRVVRLLQARNVVESLCRYSCLAGACMRMLHWPTLATASHLLMSDLFKNPEGVYPNKTCPMTVKALTHLHLT